MLYNYSKVYYSTFFIVIVCYSIINMKNFLIGPFNFKLNGLLQINETYNGFFNFNLSLYNNWFLILFLIFRMVIVKEQNLYK